jgi:hypothetical protein
MKRYENISIFPSLVFAGMLCLSGTALFGQDRVISQGVKWLRVGNLHSTFAIEGAEFEMHRTGMLTEQADGMRWPAEFPWQDCVANKAMWIGTTDWDDPVSGKNYAHKVVCVGPKTYFDPSGAPEFVPYEFKMYGRFFAPEVIVDGLSATENALNDVVEEVKEDLKAYRMIVNKLHSPIGVDVTRKLMAFSQQNHDNYFVYEYVLTNTGIIDAKETKLDPPRTLSNVVFYLQFRYAPACESGKRGWGFSGILWGVNTVNQVIGADPTASTFTDQNSPIYRMRALYSWYGPWSSADYSDWGSPDPKPDHAGILGADAYPGLVTLHADKSNMDHSDDPYQPKGTWYVGFDNHPKDLNQYDPQLMTRKYTEVMAVYDPAAGESPMAQGHPPKTHADEVGNSAANLWTSDAGGVAQGVGYGPYTLAPGDSVRIVVAEAVAGIDRRRNLEVGRNWLKVAIRNENPATTMIMPDGTALTNPSPDDADAYKEAWFKTGVDSIYKTFRHAMQNYASGYDIPLPPPPPSSFTVTSGGDRIILQWADNATSWPNFDGYEVWRKVSTDTFFTQIFSCNKEDAAHEFEDVTALRGFDYYYYVVTKDDGSTNDFELGVPLVSSKFYTLTNQPAYLRRLAEDHFGAIRVVPNPYHIKAKELQFGTDTPDRIAFYGLPAKCKIRIYTERGELIKTLRHTDQTGDQLWDCTTESKQVIVSGLYIAHFEIPEDIYDIETGALLFSKGQQTFRKFIVIR